MPDTLVSTGWLAGRLDPDAPHALHRPGLRVIDVPTSPDSYRDPGHVPSAVMIDWRRELIPDEDESSGHVIDPQRFAQLASRLGLRPDDTLVFYGDEGGRHACRALWTFEYYRHRGALHLVDGGRERWQAERRPLERDETLVQPTDYPVPSAPDDALRATHAQIRDRLGRPGFAVVDARSRDEYDGVDVRAARGGHIPGALHHFWQDALAPDGSFKSRDDLARLYADVPPDADVAVHCQLGMRSAHTWFVLRHILGHPRVRNYDGSWKEWGDLPDTPIESQETS